MIKTIAISDIQISHFYNPGQLLDQITFKKMLEDLISINQSSGANVDNKMLKFMSSPEELRQHYQTCIVGIMYEKEKPIGFLISPILLRLSKPIVHSGLVIVAKNPGVDVISLLALGNLEIAYQKHGEYYITNISSTPAIIENFCEIIPNSWPNPNSSLRVSPKPLQQVVQVLKEDYMDKYFPDPEKIKVDTKRFILTSNSSEMGFVTDVRKIARSNDFKYMSFCQFWIDYSKEEDLIQVGSTGLANYLRLRLMHKKMLMQFSLSRKKYLKQKAELAQKNAA